MSVGLVVARPVFNGVFVPISADEWRCLVGQHRDLRLRSDPYCAVNPKIGSMITNQVGEADSEIYDHGEWLPFLRYDQGRLTTEHQSEFEDPTNPIRIKIAAIAKMFGAIVSTDAGDEILPW